MTPFEGFWLILCLAAIIIGLSAERLDKEKSPPCPQCRWPQGGVMPCLCAEGTPGRYEGRRS